MNHRKFQERRRADRAHSRVRSPRWRRLSIEQIESRLMLTGDGLADLDTDTFNLDSFADYAIISSDFATAVVPATDISVNQSADDRIGASDNGSFVSFRDALLGFNGGLLVSRDSLDLAPVRDGALHLLGNTPANFTIADSLRPRDLEFLSAAPGSGLSILSHFDVSNGGRGVFLQIIDSRIQNNALASQNSGDNVSIDVVAPTPSIKSADLKLDPITITTSPAPVIGVVDVQDEPVANPLKSNASSEPPTLNAQVALANEFVAIADSDAQINVDQVIDELLTSDTSVIDQSMQHGADDVTRDESQHAAAGSNSPVDRILDTLEGNDTTLVANTATDEGGMIPIREIVGKLAEESIAVPDAEQMASTDAPAEISGELARVAVMELLQGEADPAAPRETSDFTFLVATDDAAFVPERITINQADQESATLAAVQAVVDQAALAMSIVAPANPIYFAAMLSAASDAFATAAVASPLTTPTGNTAGVENALGDEGARGEAFSQWDDDSQRGGVAVEAFSSTYGLLPIVGVLAAERVVAANRKRKQNHAAEPTPHDRSWWVQH